MNARGFKPRRGQREMIVQVARACFGDGTSCLAIEAGTGTGKTAAYCLAAIPVAKALEKKIVISTATVALQEQILLRDLPDLQENAGLEFTLGLAKGRARYVCLKRLEQIVTPGGQLGLDGMDQDPAAPSIVHYQMQKAFAAGDWNGERESWAEGVADTHWLPVTMDHRGCANRRCDFYHQCPLFVARKALGGVDVIVANHDLLLADASLGGNVVLPPADDVILIVDEAHHLADKARQHFSASLHLRAAVAWADQANATMTRAAGALTDLSALPSLAQGFTAQCQLFAEQIGSLSLLAENLPFDDRSSADGAVCRFAFGQVGAELADWADATGAPLSEAIVLGSKALEQLRDATDRVDAQSRDDETDNWMIAINRMLARAEAMQHLLADYASAGSTPAAGQPQARWVSRTAEADLHLETSPIEPAPLLQRALWSRYSAVTATSATLTALGQFDHFLEQSGLDAKAVCIPSPFDYPNVGVLAVPAMRSDPRDADRHSDEVGDLLPDLLAQARSALVLFTSWKQMRRVRTLLAGRVEEEALLFQGDSSRQAMLTRHRTRIDAGEASYLMGLASLSEGVDLPGDYCRHVVIVKLPFAAPDNPLDQSIAERVSDQGGNPFMEIAVPEVSLKLVQACGRLIRDESDHGRITLLDRRVLTRNYGALLLDALPPFRRELG